MTLIFRWVINALALIIIANIVPGFGVDGLYTALIAALVLGLANALIRPILFILTLPITIITLGLFTFVLNALMVWLARTVAKGFEVTVVVSVGGSIVVPEGCIDVAFLKFFRRMILQQIKKGWRFVIVVGGGGTARHYQQAAKNIGELTHDDLDWLGIHSTRLNGHLMRTIFREVAHPIMFKDPTI